MAARFAWRAARTACTVVLVLSFGAARGIAEVQTLLILADEDADARTGCRIPTGDGPFEGIESVLLLPLDSEGAADETVVATFAVCDAPSGELGPAVVLPAARLFGAAEILSSGMKGAPLLEALLAAGLNSGGLRLGGLLWVARPLADQGAEDIFADGVESGSVCTSSWSDWTGATCGEHCDIDICASGCCAANVCTPPSPSACGTNGNACIACGETSDGCVAGVCACGAGPACAAGQRCLGGSCVCDATSCPAGCCNGATCTPPTVNQCGIGGSACAACGIMADNCAGGACACGLGPACGAGQRCVAGGCVCDATSCPSGCCNGATCTSPTVDQCGTGGSACVACGPSADSCVGGVCRCGIGAACPAGQSCIAGLCL